MMGITVNCDTSPLGRDIDNGKTIICQGLFKQLLNKLNSRRLLYLWNF